MKNSSPLPASITFNISSSHMPHSYSFPCSLYVCWGAHLITHDKKNGQNTLCLSPNGGALQFCMCTLCNLCDWPSEFLNCKLIHIRLEAIANHISNIQANKSWNQYTRSVLVLLLLSSNVMFWVQACDQDNNNPGRVQLRQI